MPPALTRWPFALATCTGVSPPSVAALTLAPAWTSALATLMCPPRAAAWRRDTPAALAVSGEAPEERAEPTPFKSPSKADSQAFLSGPLRRWQQTVKTGKCSSSSVWEVVF